MWRSENNFQSWLFTMWGMRIMPGYEAWWQVLLHGPSHWSLAMKPMLAFKLLIFFLVYMAASITDVLSNYDILFC